MSGKRRGISLVWSAALALAAGCGQDFTKDDGTADRAGSAAGGTRDTSEAGSSGASATTAGVAHGGSNAGSAGRGQIFPGVGGSLVAQAGDSGDAGAAGAPDDVPPPIPVDGLELWFDAARGVGQAGGVVSQWADQSGHHRDALQTASNLRPKLVDGALAGKPALVFDGSADAGDYMRIPTLDVDFAKGVSIFVAGQQASAANDTTCEGFFEASNGPEIDDIHLGTWQKSIIFEVFQLYINDTNFPLLFDQPQILGAILDPSRTAQVRRNTNGVGSSQLDLPALTPRTQVFLGRSLYQECQPLHGAIGEVLVYSRAVADIEVIQIESYLQKRWGCCTE